MTHPAELSAQPVVRDRWGCWTHPAFFTPADNREYPLPGEFEAWLTAHHLISATVWMDNEVPEAMSVRFGKTGDCSDWLPSCPAGEGWFTGSIHDTEDGAVCIWLRRRDEGGTA